MHTTRLFSAIGGRATKSREERKQKETKMYCTKCGNQIDGSAAFCTKCRTPTNGKPATSTGEVKSHMVWAILQTLVCIPAGVVPLIYACKVNSKLAQGDIAGAQAASKAANGWIIANVIVGLLGGLFYFILAVAGAAL